MEVPIVVLLISIFIVQCFVQVFVDFFSRCLNAEYSSKGVIVQVLNKINMNCMIFLITY